MRKQGGVGADWRRGTYLAHLPPNFPIFRNCIEMHPLHSYHGVLYCIVMGRKRTWSDDEAAEVMSLVDAGLSYREVCKRLHISLGMVQRIVSSCRGEEAVCPRKEAVCHTRIS
jgi:hypothetical protein